MVHKIKMPRVDANVQEATVGAWCVQCGERVEAGEPLVEIITDKANFELESDVGGVLRRQVAAEKSVVPVGYVIALVADSVDEPLPVVDEENETVMKAYEQALLTGDFEALDLPAAVPAAQAARDTESDRVRAVPAARRLAKEWGIDLAEVASHVQGVIRVEDVQSFAEREGAGE